MSIVYVSDVERGNRRPLDKDRTIKVADFLKADPAPLMRAAALERGVIEYDISKAGPLEADVVGGLVSGFARGGVTDDQLRRINGILQKGGAWINRAAAKFLDARLREVQALEEQA